MLAVKSNLGRQQVVDLAELFLSEDIKWMIEQLQKLVEEPPLPESATIDEAIALYHEGRCDIREAADLAGIDRWTLQKIMYEQGKPATYGGDLTDDEFEELEARVEEYYARHQ